MSDARLRLLEQRFQASGSLEAEVELLRARSRAGILSEADLNLAAQLGSLGARALKAGAGEARWKDVTAHSDEAELRVMIAAGRDQFARCCGLGSGGPQAEGCGCSVLRAAVEEAETDLVAGELAQIIAHVLAGAFQEAPLLLEPAGALIPWLLGHGDPLRDRVLARAADPEDSP